MGNSDKFREFDWLFRTLLTPIAVIATLSFGFYRYIWEQLRAYSYELSWGVIGLFYGTASIFISISIVLFIVAYFKKSIKIRFVSLLFLLYTPFFVSSLILSLGIVALPEYLPMEGAVVYLSFFLLVFLFIILILSQWSYSRMRKNVENSSRKKNQMENNDVDKMKTIFQINEK